MEVCTKTEFSAIVRPKANHHNQFSFFLSCIVGTNVCCLRMYFCCEVFSLKVIFKTDLSQSFKFRFGFIKWVNVSLDFVHIGIFVF